MPQSPIILPLIITGLTLGSVLISQTKTISKKKLTGVSLLSGLLNSAYAFILYEISPPPTFARAGTQFRVQTGSETSFIISSFITGFIFVLAVCGIALAYARFRGKREQEEDEGLNNDKDEDDEEEKTLEDS